MNNKRVILGNKARKIDTELYLVRMVQKKLKHHKSACDALIKKYMRLVYKIVERYKFNCNHLMSKDDMVSEGVYGLILGIEAYTFQLKGIKLMKILDQYIFKYVYKSIFLKSKGVAIEGGIVDLIVKRMRIISELQTQNLDEITLRKELCQRLGIKMKRLYAVERAHSMLYCDSLDAPYTSIDEDEGMVLLDMVANDGLSDDSISVTDPLQRMMKVELKQTLHTIIQSLNAEERNAVIRYWQLDGSDKCSLSKMADELQTDVKQFRKSLTSAKEKMKARLNASGFNGPRDFVD